MNQEKELTEQPLLISQLAEMSPDVISIIELPSQRVLYTNKVDTHGFEVEAWLNMTAEEKQKLIHPDDHLLLNNYYQSFNAETSDDEIKTVEFREKNSSGEWLSTLLRGRVLERNDDGTVRSILRIAQNITEQKKASDEILYLKDKIARIATDKYYTLFNSIDEGFCIVELICNNRNKVIDIRYLEANPAFERHTGLKNVVGKWGSEVAPGIKASVYETYHQVIKTGEPARFENYNELTGRWFSVYASRFGTENSHQLAVVFNDITDRKHFEQRQEYLLQFSDALHALSDPVEIQQTAIRVAGTHLGVDRAFYAEFGLNSNTYTIADNYVRPGFPKRIGQFPVSISSGLYEWFFRGETPVINDVEETPVLSDVEKEASIEARIYAVIGVPLIKGGRLVAQLGVQQSKPREWTPYEINILQETAERTWAAVERAKAEEAMRESEAHLMAAFEVLPLGIAVVDTEGRAIISNKEMQRFLPSGIIPSKDKDHIWRWRGYDPEGRVIEPKNFPGARALRGETVLPGIEMIHTQEDGTEVWVNIAAIPVKNKEEAVREAVIVITDISNKKKITEALQESGQRLKDLNENLERRIEDRTQELILLKLKQDKEKLNAVIFAQEQERTRIGEALHNGVGQLLFAVQNRLQLIHTKGEEDDKNMKASIQLILDAIQDTRRISFELMPPMLKDFGLSTALGTLVSRIFGGNTAVKLNIDLKNRLPEDLEISIYRIVQEAMNNIVKHANAAEATVLIRQTKAEIKIKISDNGDGFSHKHAEKHPKGVGLQTIKNRVKLLDGEIKFTSSAGKGTSIEIRIPI